jgi:hypothetical protein
MVHVDRRVQLNVLALGVRGVKAFQNLEMLLEALQADALEIWSKGMDQLAGSVSHLSNSVGADVGISPVSRGLRPRLKGRHLLSEFGLLRLRASIGVVRFCKTLDNVHVLCWGQGGYSPLRVSQRSEVRV